MGTPCFWIYRPCRFHASCCCCCTISPPCALVSYTFSGIIHLNQIFSIFFSHLFPCWLVSLTRSAVNVSYVPVGDSSALAALTFPKSAPIDGCYNIIKAPIDGLRQVFLFSTRCLAGSMLLKGYYGCSLIDAERRGQCNDPAVSPPQPPLLHPAPCTLSCSEDCVLDGSGG